MKSVMTRAWELAKAAAKKHGGKAIDYIAATLKSAWREVKLMASTTSKIIVIFNRDTGLNDVYGWKNGKVHSTRKNLTQSGYEDEYGFLKITGHSLGEFYRIENGVKSFLGLKVHN